MPFLTELQLNTVQRQDNWRWTYFCRCSDKLCLPTMALRSVPKAIKYPSEDPVTALQCWFSSLALLAMVSPDSPNLLMKFWTPEGEIPKFIVCPEMHLNGLFALPLCVLGCERLSLSRMQEWDIITVCGYSHYPVYLQSTTLQFELRTTHSWQMWSKLKLSPHGYGVRNKLLAIWCPLKHHRRSVWGLAWACREQLLALSLVCSSVACCPFCVWETLCPNDIPMMCPGWESQLLETGFLAIFLCPVWSLSQVPRSAPPSLISIWTFRWLIVRIMLGAVSKQIPSRV